ncbi:putative Ankyrin repeat and MYND domain-containing protein 1 [Hypsibius exemplaris]|uniref:Ankyrin repeat and MYND domain-containing protein 1 n=1 Tax=Hypsibius exemplaris TaxID=2072580 RepID=A0A1W0WFR7_HYPEX|nr:putative Ankyrin repeat and MYND domain-containing protein 1 [Hypsibius exemplaris]
MGIPPEISGDVKLKDFPTGGNLFQAFGDGGCYSGETWNGMRHGRGLYTWSNSQSYDGYFFYDQMHGPGRFVWPDGRLYLGYFYANLREGYGKVVHSNGDLFEGLFRKGELFGPGVATYVNGTRDVGLWFRTHLLQLPQSLLHTFDAPYFQEVLRMCPIKPAKSWHPNKDNSAQQRQPPRQGQTQSSVSRNPGVKRFELNAASTGQENADFQRVLDEQFDRSTNKDPTPEKSKHGKHEPGELLRNTSERLVEMCKFTRKMQGLSKRMSFSPDSVLILPIETKEASNPGGKQQEVLELFKASSSGDLRKVQELVFQQNVNVDACDVHGLTPLMAATVQSRESVMNLLLDFGANINHVTNDGLSAVEMCFAYYHCFVEKFNMWQENDPSVESVFTAHTQKPALPAATSAIGKLTKDPAISPLSSLRGLKSGAASTAGLAKTPHAVQEVEHRLDQADQKESFKSLQSLKKVPISIPPTAFLRAGDQLFAAIPHLFHESEMDEKPQVETPLFLAWLKAWQSAIKNSLLLLLRRGAEWKNCHWPQPLLFSAVRGLDGDLVRCLFSLGAHVNERMVREGKNVTPLLIACGMPGIGAVEVVEALLAAGADPNLAEVETLPEDPKATEQLLEILVLYKAKADIPWNNSSPLTDAVLMGNVKMVRALLDAGCNVNQDLGAGHGNALCVLATLATPEGFLHTNNDADTIKQLMNLLLESADFTIKIPLLEGPQGSPLQPSSPALNPEFKATLEDLRRTILEAYKLGTQISVLRRRKLMLAGSVTPQLKAMLHRYPWLIDGPDPSLTPRLNLNERQLLESIANIRDRIEELMVADIMQNGQKVRPTLKVPYKEPDGKISPVPEDNLRQQMADGENWNGIMVTADSPTPTPSPELKKAENDDAANEDEEEGDSENSAKNGKSKDKEKGKKAEDKKDKKGKTKKKGKTTPDRKDGKKKKKSGSVTDGDNSAEDLLNDLVDGEALEETESVDTENFETPADKKVRERKEKKIATKKEDHAKRKDKQKKEVEDGPKKVSKVTAEGERNTDDDKEPTEGGTQIHADKSAKKKKQKSTKGKASPHCSGPNHKKHHDPAKFRKIRQGIDRDGLVMENHPVHEKKGVHAHDPEYEPSHGKLPHHDPFDPDHVTLVVPAVHLLDKEGDSTPLDHKTMEYRYCSNCGKSTGIGLFACPRCNSVFYDSKDCQTAHWPTHKDKCRKICRRKEHNEHHKTATLEHKAARRRANSKQGSEGGACGNHGPGTPGAAGGPSPFSDFVNGPNSGPEGKGKGKGQKGVKKQHGEEEDGPDGGHGEYGRQKGDKGKGHRDKANRDAHERDERGDHGRREYHRKRNDDGAARKVRKSVVAEGGMSDGKGLKAIKHAGSKNEAEWMGMLRGINVLRMDREMQQFVNSHYRQLVNKRLNLAEAHDLVELRNAEYYAAIAFHQHVSVRDLLEYKQDEAMRDSRVGVEVTSVTREVKTKMATTFFAFEKVNDGNFSFT